MAAFLRSVSVAAGLMVACGGISAKKLPEESSSAGVGQEPGDSCVCPADQPAQGDPCSCEGLECVIARAYLDCARGEMVCNDGAWQRVPPVNNRCPASFEEIDGNDYCSGEGSCQYEIDVGCGPDIIEFSCQCVDTAWYLPPYPTQLPPLCDCRAITTERVCAAYRQCGWTYEIQGCGLLE